MRVGILGGTFNPPHIAHLICAQEAWVRLELDRVLLIPAALSPFKAVDEDDPGPRSRLELCQAAVAGDDRFEVSPVEVERPGPSYTVDTLETLHSQAPDNELFLIVGADVAAGLPGWRSPERVLSLARLAVAERSGTPKASVEAALAGVPGGRRAAFFRMPRIEVSSTMVREKVRAREPISYLVPEGVRRYIERHNLYGGHTQC